MYPYCAGNKYLRRFRIGCGLNIPHAFDLKDTKSHDLCHIVNVLGLNRLDEKKFRLCCNQVGQMGCRVDYCTLT